MEETVTNQNPIANPTPVAPNPGPKKPMNINKTVFLVAGLVVLTAVLLFISLTVKKSSVFPTSNKEAQTDFAHTTLAVSSEPSVSETGTSQVDVNIDSADNKITGVQLEISYDPKAIGNVDIKQGSFLPNSTVIRKQIDPTTGHISFVLGSQLGKPGIKGQGVVATITYNKLTNDETIIGFLPQTLVTADGYDLSVLKETVSGTITGAASASTSSSTSATPSQ